MHILCFSYNRQQTFQANNKGIAQQVADVVMSNQRVLKGEIPTPKTLEYFREKISSRVLPFITKNEPIPIVLVGFPMKSPSRLKTISSDADRAEFEALKHLQTINNAISDVYSSGSTMKIYSDGRLFVNTIVGSSDNNVTIYVEKLRQFLGKLKASNIEILCPEDYYHTTPDKAREMLFRDFLVDKDEMLNKIPNNPFLMQYKTFMRDFYAKDIRAQYPSFSIRESKNLGEKVAVNVICIAESLSNYIKSVFHNSILRLSIHATSVNDIDNKIGIFLNSSKVSCPSPWHGAALRIQDINGSERFIVEKRGILEKIGCHLVPDIDGKGAYYELPPGFDYDYRLTMKENLKKNGLKSK